MSLAAVFGEVKIAFVASDPFFFGRGGGGDSPSELSKSQLGILALPEEKAFDDDDGGSDLIFVPVPLCGRPLGGLGEGSGEGTVAFLGCF